MDPAQQPPNSLPQEPAHPSNNGPNFGQPPPQPASVNQTPYAPQPAYSSQPTTPPPQPGVVHPSPGNIILQWLTYAFWGWTVFAMSLLTGSVLANFIADAHTGGFTPYAVASVLVLLPISIVCDLFYSKQEPLKKTGAATIVLVIHAVLFALFGIGAVIAIVISLVTLFTSNSDTSGSQVALFTAIIVAILYAAVLLRTVNPPRFPWIRRYFIIFMTIVVGIVSVLGIVGPVAHERSTRNDRLIEDNLTYVESGINNFATKNKQLPSNLSDITLNGDALNGDAKKLVSLNLVKYTPNTKTDATALPNIQNLQTSKTNTLIATPQSKNLYYQLCATYVKATKNPNAPANDYLDDSDGYTSYLSAYEHPAGQVCYKLKTVVYNSLNPVQ